MNALEETQTPNQPCCAMPQSISHKVVHEKEEQETYGVYYPYSHVSLQRVLCFGSKALNVTLFPHFNQPFSGCGCSAGTSSGGAATVRLGKDVNIKYITQKWNYTQLSQLWFCVKQKRDHIWRHIKAVSIGLQGATKIKRCRKASS